MITENLSFHPKFIFRSPVYPTNQINEGSLFNEALYLASPVLYREQKKYLEGLLKEPKAIDKLKHSLYKYKSRASFRCTPFGLFAGLGLGQWGDKSEILFDSDMKKSLYRQTRLDMNVLCSIASELPKYPQIMPYLNYFPNTSLYRIGETYRYIEYEIKDNRRVHRITKVDYSQHLELLLERCSNGAKIHDLIKLLVDDEIPQTDASDYISELINAQIIVNELEPNLTGISYFDSIIAVLKRIQIENPSDIVESLSGQLNAVKDCLIDIDSNILNTISEYEEIYSKLKQILPNLSEVNLFQTDLYRKSKEALLTKSLQEKLLSAIRFLNKINPSQVNTNLEDFKARFNARYEGDEVPLLIALDKEAGIGYPFQDVHGDNLLADNIEPPNPSFEQTTKWDEYQATIFRLLIQAIKSDAKIIEIRDTDFKALDYSNDTLPATFSIMFKVIEESKIEIVSIGGTSAINLIGRFGNGLNEIKQIIDELSNFEKKLYPNEILAEIIHLPESRTGNILARPIIREHELLYLGSSPLPKEFQINIGDLYLSIVNNDIVLIDKSRNTRIRPRLGNAHNFSNNSLPVYHFLCDLQAQESSKNRLGFSFGQIGEQFDFLPRIEREGVILSLATWKLNEEAISTFNDRTNAFLEYQSTNKIPEKFNIVEGDNKLLIDCTNDLSLKVFYDYIKNKKIIFIEEYIFNENYGIIKDGSGNSYNNEFIAFALNKSERKKGSTPVFPLQTITKYYPLGSEWYYLKIYCGVKIADEVLKHEIKDLTETLLHEGIIKQWFFIRYNDNGTHLRLRLQLTEAKNFTSLTELINLKLSALIRAHIIANIQVDTYNREISRYGSTTIQEVEKIFYYDSQFVVSLLSSRPESSISENLRWQAALLSADTILKDFHYDLEGRRHLVKELFTVFHKEHGDKKELKLLLDKKYREHKNSILECLSLETKDEILSIVKEALILRSKQNKKCVDFILKQISEKNVEVTKDDMVASLIHMNLNRIFVGRNRTNEYVIYSFLKNYYESLLYKQKSLL